MSRKYSINEDTLTEELYEGLKNTDITDTFMHFLFGGKVPKAILKCDTFEIDTQYRFSESSRKSAQVGSRGRLDLMLIGEQGRKKYAVGVESKVWDEEKPSRLHNYVLLLDKEPFTKSWLFEIVREKDYDVEGLGYVKGVLLWRDFYKFLVDRESDMEPLALRASKKIRNAIEASGALDPRKIKRGLRKGLIVSKSAESFLGRLLVRLNSVDGLQAMKMHDKGLPVKIRAGLKSWENKYGAHWHQRLWITAKEPSKGVFAFKMSFIFHNANFTDFDFSKRHLSKWASPFEELGFEIYRGPDRGWDGKKRIRIHAPYEFDTKPKYFNAEESDTMTYALTTENEDPESVLDDAVDRAKKYLDIFDRVY